MATERRQTHNVTMITEEGGSVHTQLFASTLGEAEGYVATFVMGRHKGSAWAERLIRAYIFACHDRRRQEYTVGNGEIRCVRTKILYAEREA